MARAGDVAQSHTYIQLFGGYAISSGQSSYYDDVYDQVLHDGFVVGAALGTYVGDGLRLEQELSYVRNENDATDYDESDVDDYHDDYTGHTSSIYILTNLWKEVGLGPLRPYAGAGLGVGFIKNDGDYDDGENGWNDTGFGLAAQLGAGLRFGLGDSLALDAGYRLKGIVDATFTDIGVDEQGGSGNSVYSHTFQLGAAYAINGSAMPDLGEGGNWYVSLFGGAAMPSSGVWSTADVYTFEGKTGFSVGMAIGTELADGLRGELELSYLNYALDAYSSETGSSEKASGNLKAGFLLANVWNDIDLGFMTPYVGGGLGFALAHMSDGDFDGDQLSDSKGLSFAGQFGVGARFGVTDHLQLDVGYRFKSIIEAMIQTDDENVYENAELASHQHVLQAGLTYNIAGTPTVEPMADVADSPDGLYASLFGGAVFPAHTHIASNSSNYIAEFKTGFIVGAAVGASLTDSLRGEVELSYLSSDVKQVTEEDSKA